MRCLSFGCPLGKLYGICCNLEGLRTVIYRKEHHVVIDRELVGANAVTWLGAFPSRSVHALIVSYHDNFTCLTRPSLIQTLSSAKRAMAIAGLELSTLNETQLVEAGKTALKERRYDAAVQMFDYAWTRVKSKDASKIRDKTMLLLDLLVEARIGLSRFDRAFKDARTMVRCNRTDARGYLRCGQLKRLQGDRQAALDFCTKGMEHVPTDHKLYKVLQTQHNHTARAIALLLPTDPINVLPPEILRMILSYFTYRDATSLLRVSKTWSKTVLATHPTIATSLDFSQSQRSISRPAFLACLRRLSRSPSTLVAEHLSRGATGVLFDRLQSWTLLTSLKLRKVNLDIASVRWSKFKLREVALGEEQKVTTTTFLKILRSCSQLEVACFVSVKNGASVEDMLMQDELSTFPNLKRLVLGGMPAPTVTITGQATGLQWPVRPPPTES